MVELGREVTGPAHQSETDPMANISPAASEYELAHPRSGPQSQGAKLSQPRDRRCRSALSARRDRDDNSDSRSRPGVGPLAADSIRIRPSSQTPGPQCPPSTHPCAVDSDRFLTVVLRVLPGEDVVSRETTLRLHRLSRSNSHCVGGEQLAASALTVAVPLVPCRVSGLVWGSPGAALTSRDRADRPGGSGPSARSRKPVDKLRTSRTSLDCSEGGAAGGAGARPEASFHVKRIP